MTSIPSHLGYQGDLCPEQLSVLSAFKSHLAAHNIASPFFDDWLLLRFCRARKFDLPKVIKMFTGYLEFRETQGVDTILSKDLSQTEEVVKLYYDHGYIGTDKLGRPIKVERLHTFDSEKIAELVTMEDWTSYLIRENETLVNVV
jgi:hypothetical protein